MSKIVVSGTIIEQLKAHAQTDAPNECCGLLSGREAVVETRHPLRNLSLTPERNYFASPEDLFRAMRKIREGGQTLLAIYHSHPSGPPYPSKTDIEMASYPNVIHLIISLVAGTEILAFSIKDGVVAPVALEVANATQLETTE